MRKTTKKAPICIPLLCRTNLFQPNSTQLTEISFSSYAGLPFRLIFFLTLLSHLPYPFPSIQPFCLTCLFLFLVVAFPVFRRSNATCKTSARTLPRPETMHPKLSSVIVPLSLKPSSSSAKPLIHDIFIFLMFQRLSISGSDDDG